MTPSGDIRIIHTSDSNSEFVMLPEKPEKEDFYEYVDHLAANGVDVYAMDVFIAGFCMWTSRFTDIYERYEKFLGLKSSQSVSYGNYITGKTQIQPRH